MARSSGHIAVAACLCACGYLLATQLATFVNLALQTRVSDRHLRSRVSLAATAADVNAAEKDFKLKKWAAGQLAGSAQEAAAVARAQQAEATYAALKAELEGAPAGMPAMPAPVAAAPAVVPVAAAPVAAAPSTVSKADLAAAKQAAQLLTWSANKLMSEGAPQAAAMKAKADQAVAAFEALKQAEASGAAAPAPVAAAPVAVPVAAAPVAAASVSKQDLAAAKQNAQLLTWSANKLMSEGAPQAAAMKAKADQAVAAFEAMKQAEASGAAMSVVPAAPAPVAVAPVAAPVAAAASAVSKEDLAKAKQAAQLLTWSANKLMSEGAPQAAAMKAKADQAVAAFEALKQGAAAPVAQAPAAPVAVAPAAPAPVAAAAVASSPSGSSREEVLKAKKEMDLHEWAAERLASSGSLQAAVMKAKAEQSRQTYEALKEQMVYR